MSKDSTLEKITDSNNLTNTRLWNQIKDLEQKIDRNPKIYNYRNPQDFLNILNEYIVDSNGTDQLGITNFYLVECLKNKLPHVAVQTAIAGYETAFINSGNDENLNLMVWKSVRRFTHQLDEYNYQIHTAYFLAKAAEKFPNPKYNSGLLFQQSGEIYSELNQHEEAADAHEKAAVLFEGDNSLNDAISQYIAAANNMIQTERKDKFGIAQGFYRNGRRLANNTLNYRFASDLLLLEKKLAEKNLQEQIKKGARGQTFTYISQVLIRITCGNFEKPLRVLASSFIIILFFTILYFPPLHIIEVKGIIPTNDFVTMFVSSLHLSIITFSTVGYGNMYPVNNAGMLLTALEAILGVLFTGLFLFCLGRANGPR